jgi:type I restriction enzyme S subunit
LSNSKGSTVRMITKDSIEEFEFKIPPVQKLKDLENNFIAIDDKIESNIEQVNQLEQIRNSLLSNLMSGQLEVAV